jgi:DNA-binding MurR/RpiR family transcriptional regulator
MTSYETRIRETRSDFSPSFIRLADFMLDSYRQAAFLTATELAHLLDLDPATVVRFSQLLGYRGYPEFQREIREKVKKDLLIDRKIEPGTSAEAAETALREIVRNLEFTQRTFPIEAAEELITALDEVERVIVLAEGLAISSARCLASWLEAVGYTIHLAGGSPPALARAVAGAHKSDLAIAIEITQETPFIAHALSTIKGTGARTAAIFVTPSSELAHHADLILSASINPTPGIGQILLDGMVYTLIQMLMHARPGRFEKTYDRVRAITQSMIDGNTE